MKFIANGQAIGTAGLMLCKNESCTTRHKLSGVFGLDKPDRCNEGTEVILDMTEEPNSRTIQAGRSHLPKTGYGGHKWPVNRTSRRWTLTVSC